MLTVIYKVYDTTGAYLRSFKTYKMAATYRMVMGRPDWEIKTINLNTNNYGKIYR